MHIWAFAGDHAGGDKYKMTKNLLPGLYLALVILGGSWLSGRFTSSAASLPVYVPAAFLALVVLGGLLVLGFVRLQNIKLVAMRHTLICGDGAMLYVSCERPVFIPWNQVPDTKSCLTPEAFGRLQSALASSGQLAEPMDETLVHQGFLFKQLQGSESFDGYALMVTQTGQARRGLFGAAVPCRLHINEHIGYNYTFRFPPNLEPPTLPAAEQRRPT